MAFKTVTMSVEAYEALAKLKQGKESFTEVILRVAAPKKKTWRDFVGTLTDDEADAIEKGVAEVREQMKKEFDKWHY